MDIYNAIMKAASAIEQFPDGYRYMSTKMPEKPSCGSPACALGWIGVFADRDRCMNPWGYPSIAYLAHNLLGLDAGEFYLRMDDLSPGWRSPMPTGNPEKTAAGLRLYAAKYHTPAKVAQPPDWNAIAARQTIGEHERSQELA